MQTHLAHLLLALTLIGGALARVINSEESNEGQDDKSLETGARPSAAVSVEATDEAGVGPTGAHLDLSDTRSCLNINCFLEGVTKNTSPQHVRFIIMDEPVLATVRTPMLQLFADIRSTSPPADDEIAERVASLRDHFLTIARHSCDVDDLNQNQLDFIDLAFVGAADPRSLLNVLNSVGQRPGNDA